MSRHKQLQGNFNGGVFSPRMFGRTELAKYGTAAAQLQNMNLTPQGGVHRRSGARHVNEQKNSADLGRLVPFVFSDDAAYVIAFESGVMRFYKEEGQLLEAPLTILSASEVNATTEEFESTGHGYSHQAGPVQITTDDTLPGGTSLATNYWLQIAQGTTIQANVSDIDVALNQFTIADHGYTDQMGPFQFESSLTLPVGLDYNTDYYVRFVSANIFEVSLSPGGAAEVFTTVGTGIHEFVPTPAYVRDKFRLSTGATGPLITLSSTGAGTHTLTPTDPDPIEVKHSYLPSELADMSFAQSADVLYICHPSHPPAKLERFSTQGFQLIDIEFIDGPYLAENITDETLQASAVTGSGITITSSVPLFKGSDVGRSVRIKGNNHWGWAVITQVNAFTFADSDFTTDTFVATDVNTGADTITLTGHAFVSGEKVRFTDGGGGLPATAPAGLIAEGKDVWVFDASANTITLHTNETDALTGASPINIQGVGGATANTITGSRINVALHGFVGSEGPLFLTNRGGALPQGLSPTQEYYVRLHTPNSFSLSETRGGEEAGVQAVVGGGTHSMNGTGVPVTTCLADVKAEFDDTNARDAWRIGAWSSEAAIGYPRAVTFHEQRLWFASNPGAPQTIYASKTADFEAFSPTGDITGTLAADLTDLDDTVDDNNAIVYAIGANRVDAIRWLHSTVTLLVGTKASTWSGSSPSVSGESVTPANFQVIRASSRGASKQIPVLVDHQTVWVSDTGLKVMGFSFDAVESRELVEDLTILAEHITRTGVVDLVYTEEPWNQVWMPLANGTVAILTLSDTQKISGFTTAVVGGSFVSAYDLTLGTIDVAEDEIQIVGHGLVDGDRVQFKGASIPAPFVEYRDYYVNAVDDDTLAFYASEEEALGEDGKINITATGSGSLGKATNAIVESLASIPSPEGDASKVDRANRPHDQLWMLVKRTINGETRRYIEFMEDAFEDDDLLEDGFFVDSGITYNGAPTTSITGLGHLTNMTVDVLADGEVILEQTVSATGTLTLATAASKVHIGFRVRSLFESLRINIAGSAFTQGGKEADLGRIDHLVLRLHATMAGKFGTTLLDLDDLDLIDADHDMDAVAPSFSGDIEVPYDGEYNTDAKVFVVQDEPLPMTLLAIMRKLQKGERGERT